MFDHIPALSRYLHKAGGVTRLVSTPAEYLSAIAEGYVVDPNTLPPAAATEVVDEAPASNVEPVADDATIAPAPKPARKPAKK